MEDQEGVTLIHDVHVWTISSGYEAITAHVLVDPGFQGDLDALLRRQRRIASLDFGLSHITIQLEQPVADCSEDRHVDRLMARLVAVVLVRVTLVGGVVMGLGTVLVGVALMGIVDVARLVAVVFVRVTLLDVVFLHSLSLLSGASFLPASGQLWEQIHRPYI